jgi:protein TonB
MRSAPYPSPSNFRRDLLGRRAISIMLVILIHLLAFIIAFFLSPPLLGPRKPQAELKLFQLPPPAATGSTPKLAQHNRKVQPKQVVARETPKPPVPPPVLPVKPLNMMVVSSDVFAAADIARMPSHHADQDAGADAAESGRNGASSKGNGTSLGAERLYNADWYKEPTHAEMAPYLPANLREGWGLIACRTIDHYQVDDCREIDESPPGSGLARGLRQAAWQFRVLPPRIGGRPMIGAWVSIRFDLVKGVTKQP